jgi:uncharacterized membrane protein
MSRYRERLERDLDGWIAEGLVPAASRTEILARAEEGRRLDPATALAVIGGILAGAAVIAFVAANWSEIPRLARFVMVLAAFMAAAGGSAWARAQARLILSQVLLCVSALVFAAAIGLTGQIFDLAGDPQTALRSAGLGAALLALAGGSPWAAVVALAFVALGDFTGPNRGFDGQVWPGWLVAVAPLAAAVAVISRSSSLAHAAGVASVAAVFTLDGLVTDRAEVVFLGAAMALGAGGVIARLLQAQGAVAASILYGWLVWGALLFFGVSGFGEAFRGVGHSLVWLMLAMGVVAVGRHDRHGMVTAAGVVGLLAAGFSLMANLGVDLMLAAGVFGLASLGALAVAFVLRRGRPT